MPSKERVLLLQTNSLQFYLHPVWLNNFQPPSLQRAKPLRQGICTKFDYNLSIHMLFLHSAEACWAICTAANPESLWYISSSSTDMFNWGNPHALPHVSKESFDLLYETEQIRRPKAVSAGAANSCQQQEDINPQTAVAKVCNSSGPFSNKVYLCETAQHCHGWTVWVTLSLSCWQLYCCHNVISSVDRRSDAVTVQERDPRQNERKITEEEDERGPKYLQRAGHKATS